MLNRLELCIDAFGCVLELIQGASGTWSKLYIIIGYKLDILSL